MAQTMLQNVQDVCLELGLPSPTLVAGNTDETAQQILALMNRVGDTLTTENDWQALIKEYRFQTVYYQYTGDIVLNASQITGMSSIFGLTSDFMVLGNGVMQDTFVTTASGNTVNINIPATGTYSGATYTFGQVNYAMPADYQRMVNKTQYNKSNRWSVIGPKDAQEWQWLKASYVTTGPRMRYRIAGNKFAVWPMPTANVILGFEYQSGSWVLAGDGVTYKQKFTADTDTSLFPDRLLVLGTKLKYWEIKGFDTTALFADYQRELSKFKAMDAGADTLSLAPKYPNILLTQNNLPDTGFGNTTS
jgi:hypothetical protein